MEDHFVIYIGVQNTVIIRSSQLSKPYRLDRGQGVKVNNDTDRGILLSYREMSGCCGNRVEREVVYSDETWCRWQNYDLAAMKQIWAARNT